MFASLTVVGFLFAFAWLQQLFFNRLMRSDLRSLQHFESPPSSEDPETPIPASDSQP